jgi:hypothetical protein
MRRTFVASGHDTAMNRLKQVGRQVPGDDANAGQLPQHTHAVPIKGNAQPVIGLRVDFLTFYKVLT